VRRRLILTAFLGYSLLTVPLRSQTPPSVARRAPTVPDHVQGRIVLHRELLRPARDSAARLEGLTLLLLDGGWRIVTGAAEVRGNGSYFETLAIAVDPTTGEYNARFISRSTTPGGELFLGEQFGPSQTTLESDPPPECDDLPFCSERCRGNWSVQVESRDLIAISLTKTTVTGSWWQAGVRDCSPRTLGSGSCWAANPTPQPLDTHWYVSACTRLGGGQSYGNGNTTQSGNYYNYDFWVDSKITQVSSWANLVYDADGNVTYSWFYADSGEASELIVHWVTSGGTRTDC
jgi:hypothetical protein